VTETQVLVTGQRVGAQARDAVAEGDTPPTVSILGAPPVLDRAVGLSLTLEAEALGSALRALSLTVNSTLHTSEVWATSDVTRALRTVDWTPAGDGYYRLLARVEDWEGAVASDTVTITVDTEAPSVTVEPLVLTDTHFHHPRTVDLNGRVTDTVDVAQVHVQVTDGTGIDEPSASWADHAWLAPWFLSAQSLPDGETYTVTARALDTVGHTAAVTQGVIIDVAAPSPVTTTLSSAGGDLTPFDTLTETAAGLTLTWTAATDGSGVAGYRVAWHAQTTDTVSTTLHAVAPISRSDHITPAEGQKLRGEMGSEDVYGHERWQSAGPIYADGRLTPDYVWLGERDGIYRGWMESDCSLIGADRRLSRQAPARASLSDEQRLYLTWSADALRLAWTGAHWSSDGDLFIYLDTLEPGGTITAFNPYSSTIDTVIALPGPTAAPADEAMAADWLVWVRDSGTAELLRWDLDHWAFEAALASDAYRFDPHVNGGQTDLYLPFDLLGIDDPVGAELDLLAFASEEEALALWAVMPNANVVSSDRVIEAEGGATAGSTLALAHRYHWEGLGPDLCPNGREGGDVLPGHGGAG
jgi:hypothetical protein